ncbi:MAG: gliding motility-associated C-terminal domain-containing protein, partial [Chitinophagales bacterium]
RIIGPCDDSPGVGSYWSCLPPEGDTAGTCYGIDLDMFNTIACIPPQCDDYLFTFEMQTFMCSCTKPPCDITCHYMPAGSWVITIEGKTVEETAIESDWHPDFTICEGDSIDLSAGGQWGVPPYYYEWEPTGDIADEIIVSPTDTTIYTSIIHDLCEMKDTVYQTVNVIPSPKLSPGPFEGCFEVTADAGAGYASYLWSTGETTQTILVDSGGVYYVTVTDAFGCEGVSDPIDVIINYPPEINAFPDTVFVENGELAEMNVETSSTGFVNYSWQPVTSLTCGYCETTYGIIIDAQEIFTVTGEEKGCESEPDTIVVINASTDFVVPNAFSPNGDFLNDVFNAYSEIIYPVFQLQVYDRWGEKVFESNDMTIGWDGTYLNKQQEIGVYIWVINYEQLNRKGVMLQRKGTVALLR